MSTEYCHRCHSQTFGDDYCTGCNRRRPMAGAALYCCRCHHYTYGGRDHCDGCHLSRWDGPSLFLPI